MRNYIEQQQKKKNYSLRLLGRINFDILSTQSIAFVFNIQNDINFVFVVIVCKNNITHINIRKYQNLLIKELLVLLRMILNINANKNIQVIKLVNQILQFLK